MKTNCFDRLHYFLHFLFLKLTLSLFGPMSLCRTEKVGSSAQRKGWPEPGHGHISLAVEGRLHLWAQMQANGSMPWEKLVILFLLSQGHCPKIIFSLFYFKFVLLK